MSRHRVAALFRRVTAEIRRDRPSLALLFIMPLLITGLVTFILREAQTPVHDAAIVPGQGQSGALVAGALGTVIEAQGGSAVTVADEATARGMVEDGSASVAIVLPADMGAGSTVTVITDGLDPTAEAGQVAALQKAVITAATAAGGITLPSVDHQTIYGSPNDDPVSPYAPALLAFFVYFFVYLLTGVSFLRERTGGTLERLMATPVSRGEIVTGYTFGFGIFALVQVALIMCWVLGTVEVPAIGPLPSFAIGLGVPSNGSPVIAYLVVVLLAMGAVSLGIFLSTFAHTELQIIQFIPIVLVPQFLLSGILFPITSLPAVIQPFAVIMPVTYAVNGLRQVIIRGADLAVTELQVDLLVLAAFAVFFAVIAALTIRREVA
jgi:ABC-2 type transport system permease protein